MPTYAERQDRSPFALDPKDEKEGLTTDVRRDKWTFILSYFQRGLSGITFISVVCPFCASPSLGKSTNCILNKMGPANLGSRGPSGAQDMRGVHPQDSIQKKGPRECSHNRRALACPYYKAYVSYFTGVVGSNGRQSKNYSLTNVLTHLNVPQHGILIRLVSIHIQYIYYIKQLKLCLIVCGSQLKL